MNFTIGSLSLFNKGVCRFSKCMVRVMNRVSKGLTKDKVAIIFEILDVDMLHEAMGLASSPFSVIGNTPEESANIFRAWIISEASLVTKPAMRVPIKGSLAWHRLSEDEAGILSAKWTHYGWLAEIQKMGLEDFAIVWKMVLDEDDAPSLFALGALFFRCMGKSNLC